MIPSLLAYIQTSTGITVFLDDGQQDIASDSPFYAAVIDTISDPTWIDVPRLKALIASEIERLKLALKDAKQLRAEPDGIYFRDRKLNDRTATLIERLFVANQSMDHLERFFEKLFKNPSFRAIEDLYAFLEAGKMPITTDGCFLAYKAVRQNFYDIHSGRFDNSIGQTVELPRNEVDEDPNRTCSRGLHVCSFDYLPHFAHANGHVVIVKIDPADVVAIPSDYNNTKMRVSKYTVVGEVPNWYQERRDTLALNPVVDDYDPDSDYDDDYDNGDYVDGWIVYS